MEQAPAETAGSASSTPAGLLRHLSPQQALDTIVELLASFPDDRWSLTPKQRVELAVTAQTATTRMQALAAALLAEADKDNAFRRATGSTSAIFIANHTHVTARQAAGMLWDAQRLDQHPQVRNAALAGDITMGHVRAVNKAMEQMPDTFTTTQKTQAETLLIDLAAHCTPDDVLRDAPRIARQIDPVDADDREKTRLAKEREQAWRDRSLNWGHDRGSLTFHGSLPLIEGAAFKVLIEAHAAQARRDQNDANTPSSQETTVLQRRADALINLVQTAQTGGKAPTLAGDRPVITITLDYHKLQAGAFDAGILPDGQPLSPGDLRRLCCDANLIPAVLGSDSEPLDVGRTSRFVTSPIRKALTIRDKTCAYPNCDKPAALCDAHHIIPWFDGGATRLDNLVLLCPYHHGLIEPDKYSTRDQWTVHIHDDGHPIFKPPGRLSS